MKIGLKHIGLLLLLAGLLASCQKEVTTAGLASLNIINANSALSSVSVNFTLTPVPFYQEMATIGYGSSTEYSNPGGTVPLTLISSADTTHRAYQGNLNLPSGSISSLYLCGSGPSVETILLRDNIPVHKDSVSGARFINLSPDAGAVNISLQGGSANEFSALAYKSITAFKSYSNTMNVMNNGGYNFQVTDASGNVLATFDWNPKIFQNNTLVIYGSEAQSSVQVFQVNNY